MSKLVNSAVQFGETENGALTYLTSGSKVLDLFAQGGALRTRTDEEICEIVDRAYEESPAQAVATLLYLRDIRGGQGEKRTFRVAMNHLAHKHVGDSYPTFDWHNLFEAMVEVGSWKDLISTFTAEEYAPFVKEKWGKKSPDLMYKWLPSVGGSKNKDAEFLAAYLHLTPKEYRKFLSKEREALKIVETSMCQNKWESINYEHVPSKAGLIYRDAFRKHDTERYNSFIEAANRNDGSVKINTGTLAPYELTGKYASDWNTPKEDPTIEALWKNLPNYTDGSNSLVVADTSGSMTGTPMDISTSLAIYFAERNTGIFHNEFVTFSRTPRFYHFEDGMSLRDRVREMVKLNICENTDLQATFKLILKTAVDNRLPESEMPKNVFVISDMDFDEATGECVWQDSFSPKTNFEAIKDQYREAGYNLPNIIFWNVDSRHDNVPVKMNEQGVVLVSGSSASTFGMAISGDLDPYKFMLSVIEKERYKGLANKIVG